MLKPVRKGLAEDEDGNGEVSSRCSSGGVSVLSSLYMSCLLCNTGREADQNRWSFPQQQSRGCTRCRPQRCASKAELAPALEILCFDSAMLH